jgi:hypothetical protein
MEINKKPWPVMSVCGIKSRIDTNPDFQRPPVWSRSQKQLLIDTILRGYDVPKLYWRKIGSSPDRYDVVDGQQRLRAIFEYHAGEFPLVKDADLIDGIDASKMKYSELPDELRLKFDTYSLDVIVLSNTDEEEVREMFLRLQNGTTLKAQERRNAMPGKMRDFVRQLASHAFFQNCAFANSRYTFDQIAAQMTAIELNGGPCNVKNANLNAMYEQYLDFDANSPKARKIRRVLDYLLRTFPDKTPELARYSVISLYSMVSHCIERYVMQNLHDDLRDWFIQFETKRAAEESLPEDQRDPELLAYKERTSHSTDAQDSIEWRQDFMLRKFFEAVPDIEQKDDQRLFSHEQRLAIFRRDKGLCRIKLKCEGVKCEWDAWEADHILPWSKGGKTLVSNGQVGCLECNTAKSNRWTGEKFVSSQQPGLGHAGEKAPV